MAVNSPSPIKAYIYESACLAKSTQSVEKVWGGGGATHSIYSMYIGLPVLKILLKHSYNESMSQLVLSTELQFVDPLIFVYSSKPNFMGYIAKFMDCVDCR